MIATKSDMNACYQAVKQFDEVEAVLLRALEIMKSMCSHDIYEAMDKVTTRRGEYDQAIRVYRKRDQAPIVPEATVGEFLGDRMQAKYARRAAHRSAMLRDDKRATPSPWQEGERGAVQTPIDDDAGVEELRSDLTEVAFETAEAS